MNSIELIKKFRPIFIFSKGEKYYPISKKNLDMKSNDIELNDIENLTSPEEPLYYHIIEEDADEIAVSYILIFPYSTKGFFNLSGERGDILSCVAVIDKRTKTIKEIYYWNGNNQSFEMKTTRPVVFITANDHKFRKEMEKNITGLRWEPEKIEDFNLSKLKAKTIEGKNFDDFLKSYNM